MPFLLLAIGILIGLYALYRFFIAADTRQVRAFFLSAFAIVFCIALFYLAVTGRLVAALVLMIGVAPMIYSHFRPKPPSKEDIIDITPIDDDKPDQP